MIRTPPGLGMTSVQAKPPRQTRAGGLQRELGGSSGPLFHSQQTCFIVFCFVALFPFLKTIFF